MPLNYDQGAAAARRRWPGVSAALCLGRPARRTSADLVAATRAETAVMQGREMPGWLRVSLDDLASDDDLSRWVDIGIGHPRSLPPKQPASSKPRK